MLTRLLTEPTIIIIIIIIIITHSEEGLQSPLVLLGVLLDTEDVLCIAIILCSVASGCDPKGMA